ncbi:MAG: hypothetical protein ACOVOG_13750 [Rubrivivax sp.]|jgi:hypothetical protein|nr:hypothetical protein [Rubrivivax sp.]
MRLRPNRSLLDAVVLRQRRDADGLGAQLQLEVLRCEAMPPAQDFIGAAPGDTLEVYSAVPEAQLPGQHLRLEAEVLGGPQGERIVVVRSQPLPPVA